MALRAFLARALKAWVAPVGAARRPVLLVNGVDRSALWVATATGWKLTLEVKT